MSQQDLQQNERNYAGMMVKIYNWLREYQKRTNGNWLVFSVGSGDGLLKCYLFGGHGRLGKIGNPNTEFSVDVMMSGHYSSFSLKFEVDTTYSRFKKMAFSVGWSKNDRNNPDDAIVEIAKKFKTNGKKFDFNFSKKQCIASKPIMKSKGKGSLEDEEVKAALYRFLGENEESFKLIPVEYKLNATRTNEAIEQRTEALKQLGLVKADQMGALFVPDSADFIANLKGIKEPDGDAEGSAWSDLYWLVANDKDWDGKFLKDFPIGDVFEYAVKDKNGKNRSYFEDIKVGNYLVGYQKKVKGDIDSQALVAILQCSRESNGETVLFKKVYDLPNPVKIQFGQISNDKDNPLSTAQVIKTQCQGSLFRLTESEAKEVRAMIHWSELKFINEIDVVKDNATRNLIRFGAPGTGKSFKINQMYENVGWSSRERVTFHPDYSYANFVGSYKPYMEGKSIVYKFVPGPFTRVLVNALRDPNGKHLLVIEEINRANTAAVFGDVFQLLDRGKNGESEYAISPSQDLAKFLREALKQPKKNDDDWWWLTTEPLAEKEVEGTIRNLKIPSNMYLWATMNSADQGVFPMDTAFKRRWSFEYVGINDGATEFTEGLPAQWDALRIAINEKLGELKVNEDKCMGPFFLAKKDLADLETFLKVFKSKVLMYLFEDAARQKRSSVFADELSTLSKIFAAVDKMRKGEDGSVFKDSLNEKLEKIIKDSSAKDKGANSQGSDSSATEMPPSHEGSAEH